MTIENKISFIKIFLPVHKKKPLLIQTISVYESIYETTNKNDPSKSDLLEDFPYSPSEDEKSEKNKEHQSSGQKEKMEKN